MWRKRLELNADRERIITDYERSKTRTMNRAVKLLAAKPRSVRELRERLLEKQWTDEEIVNGVIEKLKDYNYLDDAQFARDLSLSKLRQKPQGKRRLQRSLASKQLDREVMENAVEEAFEVLPEEQLIDEAIIRRLRLKGAPETREDIKKFYDHLLRLGFGFDLIREKMSLVREIDFES